MRSISFFHPMIPPNTTHNDLVVRHKLINGKRVPYIGKGDGLKLAEAKWRAALSQHRPDKPLLGALRVELRICWPTGGRHSQGEPKVTKPDIDNTDKVIFDQLQQLGYFKDDAAIADNRSMKMWADPAGIYVRIEEI